MQKLTARELSAAGLIAALYTILCLAFAPISFAVYQVRVAEALAVLPFLTRAAIPGLYIGCLLANTFGAQGWHDIVIGPLVTLAAAIVTRWTYHLGDAVAVRILSFLTVVIMWVGSVFLLSSFETTLRTGVGIILSLASFAPVILLARKGGSSDVGTPRYVWWLAGVALVLAFISAFLMRTTDNPYFLITGTLLLAAALSGVGLMTWTWRTGYSPSILIAPLPPVVFNAFGVSLYLAPLYGYNYWFSVQMVGVGELIACYLIGLPLLLAMRRRSIFM